jgi:glycosyltransferase involved in cell wall biosynthesis
MRVVHLEAGMQLFGGVRQLRYLVQGLERLGVDNVLLCPRGSAIAGLGTPAEVIELAMRGDLDLAMRRRIAAVLRAVRPDLLHVHSRRGADLYGGFAARRAGVAAVLTRRVESAEPGPWARFKYGAYARVIAISTAIRAQLVDDVGLAPGRVALVPSAVDTELFHPTGARGRLTDAFGLPADARVLGCIAQLIPRKGHELLLRSFGRLAERFRRLYLVCFGEGGLRATLERRIESLGLASQVRLAGFRTDIAELVPELDLLVHPAEREGLGVAVLEAMAAGVPVVACSVGGVVDLIEDGVTGLLVRPGDELGLADAIQRVLTDSALSTRLADSARRVAEAEFSVARMVEANLEIYRQVRREHGRNR